MSVIVPETCSHGLQSDPTTGGHITDGGEGCFKVESCPDEPEPATGEKCEHGVRIAQGDTFARYCSGCNPAAARIFAPRKHVPEVHHAERELDAAEYLDLPVGERIAQGGALYESML